MFSRTIELIFFLEFNDCFGCFISLTHNVIKSFYIVDFLKIIKLFQCVYRIDNKNNFYLLTTTIYYHTYYTSTIGCPGDLSILHLFV